MVLEPDGLPDANPPYLFWLWTGAELCGYLSHDGWLCVNILAEMILLRLTMDKTRRDGIWIDRGEVRLLLPKPRSVVAIYTMDYL